MKKQFYNNYDHDRFKKFNMIFEAIMANKPIISNVEPDPIFFMTHKDLNLLLEEIEKPQYVISESTGKTILLEDALFWSQDQLISEGIFDKVFDKVEEIYKKIKNGILSIVYESAEVIKKFCERVMNSFIVKIIRKKLKLDEKINLEIFKKFVIIKNSNNKTITENAEHKIDKILISEKAMLTDLELAMTTPAQIKARIKHYQDGLSGVIKLKNKKGDPLSENFIRTKIELLNNRLKEIKKGPKFEGSCHIQIEKIKKLIRSVGNSSKDEINDVTDNSNSVAVWLKRLLWLLIALCAIATVYLLITTFIWPAFYGILHGGAKMAIAGTFQLIVAGKTFIATYKAGKKAWTTGEGWGQFFLLIIGSILACLSLGSFAAKGRELIQAASAKAVNSENLEPFNNENVSSDETGNNEEISINNSGESFTFIENGRLNADSMVDSIKSNTIPGIDITDEKYLNANGFDEFKRDFMKTDVFKEMTRECYDNDYRKAERHIFSALRNAMTRRAGKGTYFGGSWFQKVLDLDSSKAIEQGKAFAKSIGVPGYKIQ